MAIFNSFLYVYQRLTVPYLFHHDKSPWNPPDPNAPRWRLAIETSARCSAPSWVKENSRCGVFFHQNADHPRISPRLSTKRWCAHCMWWKNVCLPAHFRFLRRNKVVITSVSTWSLHSTCKLIAQQRARASTRGWWVESLDEIPTVESSQSPATPLYFY